MAKIPRYDGNLKAFASEQLGNERTLFGELTFADDLTSQFTPDFLRGWGIISPSDSPSLQDFNAAMYTNGMLSAYLHQMGVAEYNAQQEYYVDSITTSGGALYISLANANTGNEPATSPAQWRPFLTSVPDATTTVKGIVELATTAESVEGSSTTLAVAPAGLAAAIAAATTTTKGVQSTFSNLRSSASGASPSVSVSADSIAAINSSGDLAVLRSVSVNPSLSALGANGLDSGVSAASTWYSVWVIWNGTTTAGLLSLSATSPVLPSGYTHKARVGWIRSDSTVNKYPLSFIQYGKRFRYKQSAGGNTTLFPLMGKGVAGTLNGSTFAPVSVSIASYFPPGVGLVTVNPSGVLDGSAVAVSPNNSPYGGWDSTTNPPPFVSSETESNVYLDIALESGVLYWASNNAANELRAIGWEDNL